VVVLVGVVRGEETVMGVGGGQSSVCRSGGKEVEVVLTWEPKKLTITSRFRIY
jgi:hypothetical protein